jgi:S-(hydroxymethyl)glutathione dehydrogenase/alcohol dehydrogenase
MYNAHDINVAIDLVSSGKVPARRMVTHVLPLTDAQRGFELAASKRDGAIKVVLELGDEG